ncbi:MAG: DUF5348 domain-containing protein [Patescibacteria group bacterium]|nr:DUF5348 domain-containing protein [Patescibacteria group bacterium]
MAYQLEPGDGNRLQLEGEQLHCGDGIELLIAGRYVAVRLEWHSTWQRWYAAVPTGQGSDELVVMLRAGLPARHSRR